MKTKNIDEYTKDQILKLQKDDIERIIKLNLANQGIRLPKKPIEPTYNEIPEPDKTVFEVDALQVVFEKKEIAEEVAKTLRENFSTLRKIEYNWEIGSEYKRDKSLTSDYQYREGVSSIVVKEVKTYSPELYAEIKDKLSQNVTLKKAYEKEKDEYDKISEKAKDTIDYVYEKVEEIRAEQAEKERKLAIFKEYLDLAEKKRPVAWVFMKKAYKVSAEEEDYINANS